MHNSLYLEYFAFHIYLLDSNLPFKTWVKDVLSTDPYNRRQISLWMYVYCTRTTFYCDRVFLLPAGL